MDEALYDLSGPGLNGKRGRAIDAIEEIRIYQHYEPQLKQGLNHSPFRKDPSPSFTVYTHDGKMYWKDHAGGSRGDTYDFVSRWYMEKKGVLISQYGELNDAIWRDMDLQPGQVADHSLFFNSDEYNQNRKAQKGEVLIQVKDIGWTKWAYSYWADRYQINMNILNEYHVGHAKEVWCTKPGRPTFLWGISTPTNPIFYFYFPKSGHIKTYAPFNRKDKKWLMNCGNDTDIQGFDQIRIKETRPALVIPTKALKEVMFLRAFHLDAFAIHGENHYFTSDFVRHVKKYSTNQLSLYDRDRPGMRSAIHLKRMHGIEHAFIREAKNITDLWEQQPRLVMNYINQLKERYQL